MKGFRQIVWWLRAAGWWLIAGCISFLVTSVILSPDLATHEWRFVVPASLIIYAALFQVLVLLFLHFPYKKISASGLKVSSWGRRFVEFHGFLSPAFWGLGLAAVFVDYRLTAIMLALVGLLVHPRAKSSLARWSLTDSRLRRAQLAAFVAACLSWVVIDPAIMPSGEEGSEGSSAAYEESGVYGEANMEAGGPSFADVEASSYPVNRTVSGCRAIDGDTLNCDGERIRLLGIDAPEMPGHCAAGRDCAPGDPYASLRSMEQLIEPSMEIVRYGQDNYGRTLAMVYVWGGSLSCRQLRSGHARYIREWDNGGVLAADCPVKAG